MSWVFLAGSFAYKLKKPVCTSLLDFRTLDARHYFCNEELRLNRRLASSVYIDVVPLVLDQAGHLRLDGNATVVDWLVKMHRIPAWLMLDSAIAHGRASAGDGGRIAAALTRFYQSLPSEPVPPPVYRTRFRCLLETNRAELGDAAYGLPPARIGALFDALSSALLLLADLLDGRARAGYLVEGHGDLRPEHVCLWPEIAIIDTLEFSRELRVLDRADEVSYLALECGRLGAAALGAALAGAYQRYSGDSPPAPLLHFYQACRASTRALLAVRHLKEEKFRYSPHWREAALIYLELASRHAAACLNR